MDSERWLRAKKIFDELSGIAPDARARSIAEACGGDAELQAEVERLLALDVQAGQYFDGLDDALDRAELAPERVGVYRIVREIGHGGMGKVYLGERADDQFEQRVAIKIVRDGIGGKLLERFRDERRILARLEHPGIAYLLDGGSLDDGRPYFVMEYVNGETITAYADRKRLSIGERLQLFRKVCAAVAYAHRNLVIHRDLKPGNVMVEEDDQGQASVKLLDFGIARIMGEDAEDDVGENVVDGSLGPGIPASPFTEQGERMLTPSYASPEQLRGQAATTASDVYALGVLLHELLTGSRPFFGASGSRKEMERAVLEDQALAPSVVAQGIDPAAATARSTDAKRLVRRLRGDLDSIVSKALKKRPEQRYASVGQLSDDIKRHLGGMPVGARRGGWRYRAGIFLRRHRWGVAVTTLVLLGGLSLGAWHVNQITQQRDIARVEAAKAQQISDLLIDLLASANPEQAKGEEITVREVLDQASERIGKELADQPDVLARMQTIIGTVYTRLGQYDKAGTALTQALDLQRSQHGPDHPETLDTMQAMATLAIRRGKLSEAEILLREVLTQRLEQPGIDPILVSSAQNDLGWVLGRQDKYDEAESLVRAALATTVATPDADPEALQSVRNTLAVLLVGQGEYEEAEVLYRQLLAQQRKLLGPAHPRLATTLNNLGVMLSKWERPREAEPVLREALAMQRELYDANHPAIAQGMSALGNVLTDLKRYDEAEPLQIEALAMRRASLKPGHPYIAVSLNSLANLYRAQHEYARAEPLYHEAIAICQDSVGLEHTWTVNMTGNLGKMYLMAGKAHAAEETLREVLRIRSKDLPKDRWKVADTKSMLGAALAKQGQVDAAEPLLQTGYKTLLELRGADDRFTSSAKMRLDEFIEMRAAGKVSS